ncbi:MAG: T9SS type A sorting domain-containing protein [bacterium]|nr:T9SS type A sorting domain-containing protein [bacterium]
MKYSRIIFFIHTLILSHYLDGQSTFVQKNIPLPGTTNGFSRDLVELNSNNFLLIGSATAYIGGELHNRLTVASIDANGNYLWHKSYGNNKFNYLPMIGSYQMLLKSKGYLYSALSVVDSNNRQAGVFIKFNLNGDTLWQRKSYGNNGQDVSFFSATPSEDNGFLICGAIQTNTPSYNNHPTVSVNVRKKNANGNEIWSKAFATTNLDYVNIGVGILQDSVTKNIFVTGYETGNPYTFGILFILDSLGTLINKFGSPQTRPLFSDLVEVIRTRDHNYLAAGVLVSDQILYSSYKKSLASLVKFDGYGTIIFSKTYDTLDVYNANTHVVELADGNFIVSGEIDFLMNHYYGKNGFIRIMKVDKDGNLLWKKYFNNRNDSNNVEEPNGMILTSNNQIAFTSVSYEASNAPVYFTFYKTDTNYCDPNAIGCYATGIPSWAKENYAIKLWPNPSQGIVHLSIDGLHFGDNTRMTVQNSLGENMTEAPLLDAESNINLTDFKNGIYLLNIYHSGIRIYSNKIILQK